MKLPALVGHVVSGTEAVFRNTDVVRNMNVFRYTDVFRNMNVFRYTEVFRNMNVFRYTDQMFQEHDCLN